MAHIPAPGEVFYGEDGTTSVVLADNYNPEYEPSLQELHEYAEYIGIDWRTEPELLHLAKEGLQAPLPHAWCACQTSDDEVYYFNFETGESLWDHPLDAQIKKRVTEEREKMKTSAMHNVKSKNKNQNNSADNNNNDKTKKNNNTKIQNISGSDVDSITKKKESTKETSLSSCNKLNKLHAITPLSQVDHKNNINNAIIAPSTSLTPLPMPFALSPPLSLPSHHFIHSHITQHAPLGVKDIEAQIRKRVDDEYAVLKKKINLEAEQEIDAKQAEMQHRLMQTKAEYEKEWNTKSRELYLAEEKQKELCRNEVESRYKTQIKEMESKILTIAREIRNEFSRSHEEKEEQEHAKAQQEELCTNTEKDKSSSNKNNNLQSGEYSHELMLYKEKLQSELDAKVEQAKLVFAQKIEDINKQNETTLRQLRSKLNKESEEKLNYVKRQSQIMIAQLESKLRQKKEEWLSAQRQQQQQQKQQVNVDKELKSIKEATTSVVTKQLNKEESKQKEEQNKEVHQTKEECERSLQQIKDEYECKITKIQEDIRFMQAKLSNKNKNVLSHDKCQATQNYKTIDTATTASTSEIATKIIRSLFNNALNEEEMKQVQRNIEIENNKYITSLKALESRHERLMREIRQLHERKLQHIHHSNSSGNEMCVFDPRKAPEYNTTLTQRKRAWLQAHPAPKYTLPSFTSSSTDNKVGAGTQRMLESEPEIEIDEQEVERTVHTQICEAKEKWTKEYDVALSTEREREMNKLDLFKKEYRAQKLEQITAQLASEEEWEEEHEQQQQLQQNEQEKEALEKAEAEKKKVLMQEELEKLQQEAKMNDTRYKAETEQTQSQITQAEQEIEDLERELEEELQKQDSVMENTENAKELQKTHERFLHECEEKHLRSGNQIKMIRLEWEAVLTALRTAIRAEEEHYELLQNKRAANQVQDNLQCSCNKNNISNINNNNNNKYRSKDESVCAEADHPLVGATPLTIIQGNDSAREIDAEVSIAARTLNVNTPLTDNKQYTRIPLHTNTGLINSSRKRVFGASTLHSLNNSCCSTNSYNKKNNETSYEAISSAPTRLSAILKQHITTPREMTICYRDVNNSVTNDDDDNVGNAKFTNNVTASNINNEGQESWMSLQNKLHALHQALRERRSVILGEQVTLRKLREEWTSDLHQCKVNKDKHQAHYLQAVKIKLEQYAHELNEKVLALKEAQSLLRLEKKRCASISGGSNTNNNNQPRRMSHQLVSIANNCQTE